MCRCIRAHRIASWQSERPGAVQRGAKRTAAYRISIYIYIYTYGVECTGEMYVHARVHVSRIGRKTLNAKCRRTHGHVQRERARVCASPGTLVSLVADSYGKQTIAGHKGGEIKAWKEKAIEKKRRRGEGKGNKKREKEGKEGAI